MNKWIKEIDLIRGVAAFCVVLIHAIDLVFVDFGIRKDPDYYLVNSALFSVQMLIMFATPSFVFISEFVLSYNYRDGLPKGFWRKRIKFILIPYIVMGVFYSIWNAIKYSSFSEVHITILKKVFLGDYHGYFILVIFQFYLLHLVFTKWIVNKIKAKYMLIFSLLINSIYLGMFNFVISTDFVFYNDLNRLPFFAWLFYFTLAFYCGRNYDLLKYGLKKYNKIVIIMPFIVGLIVLIINYYGILTFVMSKRVDIIFYTTSVVLFLIYIGMRVKSIPRPITLISKYSFSIYLIHPFVQDVLSYFMFNDFSVINLIINILIYLLLGIFLSIFISKVINRFEVGKYIVGSIRGVQRENKPKQVA